MSDTQKNPMLKVTTVAFFFSAILFFVTCRSGFLDKNTAKDNTMSSSKSGKIIKAGDLSVKDKKKEGTDLSIFDNRTTTVIPAASLTIELIKEKGLAKNFTEQMIPDLEKKIKQKQMMISSSKSMVIKDQDEVKLLKDSLIYLKRLDALLKEDAKKLKKE